MKTKTQKTNKKQESGLPSRPEQSSTVATGEKKVEKQKQEFNIHFKEREFNRALPAERVLKVLERWMPIQRKRTTVVGNWLWLSFRETPPVEVRRDLSQLGFHWSAKRKVWQHPCGTATTEPAARPAA